MERACDAIAAVGRARGSGENRGRRGTGLRKARYRLLKRPGT